jgi:hypothetical protein
MKAVMFAFLFAYWLCILKHLTHIRFVLRCAAPIRPSGENATFAGSSENQSNLMRPPDVGEFKRETCFKFVVCASQSRCFVVPAEKNRKIVSDSSALNMPYSSFFQIQVSTYSLVRHGATISSYYRSFFQ